MSIIRGAVGWRLSEAEGGVVRTAIRAGLRKVQFMFQLWSSLERYASAPAVQQRSAAPGQEVEQTNSNGCAINLEAWALQSMPLPTRPSTRCDNGPGSENAVTSWATCLRPSVERRFRDISPVMPGC